MKLTRGQQQLFDAWFRFLDADSIALVHKEQGINGLKPSCQMLTAKQSSSKGSPGIENDLIIPHTHPRNLAAKSGSCTTASTSHPAISRML